MKTTKYQLKNGLTVLLNESHKAPVVSAQMWVRTGSADEKKGEEGISHFIEHLVFKGTRKFKVGEIASKIEGSGGELNAYTSFDETVFYVTISNAFVDVGLEAIAEMMGFPTFDPTEIDNEREVVIEEIKRGMDSLGRRSSQLMFSTRYKKHPYGIPVIGYTDNIRKVTPKVLTRYYHSRYTPKNMFLLISGNFETPEMKKRVLKYFSDFKTYPLRKSNRKKEPAQKSFRVAVEKANFEQSICSLTWKAPSIKHVDTPALDVLSMLLGYGDSSRLTRNLRLKKSVVNSIHASVFSPQDDGVFSVSFGYERSHLEEALTEIQNTFVEFFTQPPTAEEMSRVLIALESDRYYSMETVDGVARSIGGQWLAAKDLKFQEKYLKKVSQVKPQDLYRVMKKYLNIKQMCVTAITNDEPKNIEPLLKTWSEEFCKTIAKTKVAKRLPSFKRKATKFNTISAGTKEGTQKIVLKNGVTVLLRPLQDSKVISAKAAFLGGLRDEAPTKSGLTELLSRTWTTGTKKRTEEQIYAETEGMATSIQALAGRNSIGLGMDFLSSFEKQAADIFLDSLCEPNFAEEPVEREKTMQLRDIAHRQDNPSSQVGRDFVKSLFGTHPYSRDLLGEEESVKSLQAKDLRALWDKLAKRKNLTIVLAGPINQKFWLEAIENWTSKLQGGARQAESFATPHIDKQVRTFSVSKKEQSHVLYGFMGLSISDPDRYALQVMQSILAGQGGRLFLELRDKNSLAYSVSPVRMEGLECGYFGAYIGCSPDKVTKAIEMIEDEFHKLQDVLVPEEELLRAQRYLSGRHDIDLQRTSAIAGALLYSDIYGIDFEEPFRAQEKYFAVTSQQVQSLAKRLLGQPPVISVVGPTTV